MTQATSFKTIFGPGVTPTSEFYQQLNQQNQNQAIKKRSTKKMEKKPFDKSALYHADYAIDRLKHIEKKDPNREEALVMVLKWIEQQLSQMKGKEQGQT